MTTIDIVDHGPDELGECPVWSVAEQVLYWADIDGRAIHRLDPSKGTITTRSFAGRPGSFVLTPEAGTLVAAIEHEIVRVDWESGATESIVELEPPDSGNRLNDGRADPAGRYIVGSMALDRSQGQTTGILHRVEPDGSHVELRRDIGVSNGLAFDPDRSRMYFADTTTQRIVMWDYDLDTGARRNERTFFDFTAEAGKPDGGCVDADGCYWSAAVRGAELIRITPDGVVDRRIPLPLEMPTMPAFGGPNLDVLYVTSLGVHEPDQRVMDATPGSLLVIDAGVQGRPEPLFG